MKKIGLIIVFLITVISFNMVLAHDENALVKENQSYKARITQASEPYTTDIDKTKYQNVKLRILDKEYEGREFECVYTLQVEEGIAQKQLYENDKVFVLLNQTEDGNITVTVEDIYRIPYLVILVVLFFIVVLAIGGKQGIKTLISLIVTTLSIFYILIPMLIKGYSAIWSSIFICTIISIITFIMIAGFKKKTLVAILSTIVGVIISGVIAIIIGKIGNITGLSDCDAQTLIYVSRNTSIDVNGLLFAGILIATVGAAMDISMSISSAMTELMKSGMNIGKDAMGTMANTLIFAYVGGSLVLIILLMLNGSSLINIVNSDIIATEILRGLCGTIGMMSAIPATTCIFGLLHKLLPPKKDIVEQMREKISSSK